jgi:hypothetical protein
MVGQFVQLEKGFFVQASHVRRARQKTQATHRLWKEKTKETDIQIQVNDESHTCLIDA